MNFYFVLINQTGASFANSLFIVENTEFAASRYFPGIKET